MGILIHQLIEIKHMNDQDPSSMADKAPLSRAMFDELIEFFSKRGDAEAVARCEAGREFFHNAQFRQSLNDYLLR